MDEITEIVAYPHVNPPVIAQASRVTVRAVAFRAAVVRTSWDEGIQAVRDAISKYSNEIMARFKLMAIGERYLFPQRTAASRKLVSDTS